MTGRGILGGHKSAGGWTYWRNEHLFREQNPELMKLVARQKTEKMYLICGPYNDLAQHFCFNHRPILEGGLKGVYERAEAQMANATEYEKEFLSSVCEGMLCIKHISEKFAKKAKEMINKAPDETSRAYFERIAISAERCPWEAPQSFYEALNSYAFLRKIGQSPNKFGNPFTYLYIWLGRLNMILH